MEIRDVVHGAIQVEPHELAIVDSPYFQRLRSIKQLGFGEYSFPGATHSRYIHSLGAMHTASRAFDVIFSGHLNDRSFKKFRAITRFAALLHDLGHGPLSHTTEVAMPPVTELQLPLSLGREHRQATHEDYTLKILLSSKLTPLLEKAGKAFGFGATEIAHLIDPKVPVAPEAFSDKLGGEAVSLAPILQQLISSELDADRMDYLRRDSHQAGVSYGLFDDEWIQGNLTYHLKNGQAFLALEHRALYSFEDFLISRHHMFLMVYFHHKSVVLDQMLKEYLSSPDCTYRIPANIEEYLHCNDAHLYAHLAQSNNPWAKRISEMKPYRVLMELHTGIPAVAEAEKHQEATRKSLIEQLKKSGISYLIANATGELSKYSGKPSTPIFVRYDDHFHPPAFIPLEECTDLFQRYGKKRTIKRIYVAPEDLGRSKELRLD